MTDRRRPPRSSTRGAPTHPRPKRGRGQRGTWNDLDPKLACIKCDVSLRYKNKSGLCVDCRNPLPFALKSGPVRLADVTRRHCEQVLEHLADGDHSTAARLLDITEDQLGGHLGGEQTG